MNNREPDYLDEQRWKPKRGDDIDSGNYPSPPSDQADRILPPEPIYTYQSRNDESTPPQMRSGCRGCVWLMAGIGGCLMVVVVVLFGAVALGFVSLGGLFGGMGNLLNPPVRADVVSSRTLVTRIQPLGVLVTIQSEMTFDDIFVGVQQNVGNSCGHAASHRVTGGVEAGIDLSQLSEDDVRYDAERNIYIVTLPYPVLTTCRVDTIQQFNRSFTMCPIDWDNVRALAQYTALTKMRDDSVEGGILDRAEQEARMVLGNVFTELGVNVEFEFRDAQSVAAASTAEPDAAISLDPNATPTSTVIGLGASCQPDPPSGWRLDPNTGGWTR